MKSFPILRPVVLGLLAALSLTAMAAAPAAGDGCEHQGRPGSAMHGMAGAEGHHGGRMGHGHGAMGVGEGHMSGHMGGHMGGWSPRLLQSLQLSDAQRAKLTELTQAQAKTMQEQLRALLTPEQLKQLDAREADARPMDGKGPMHQPR